MQIPDSKIAFVCGLSNGETLVEGRGILAMVQGEDSPWRKLQTYINTNNLSINSLYLACGDRHYVLPSVNPRFGGEVPVGYNCFRRYEGDVGSGSANYEHYICAEAIYEDYKIQLWIDEIENMKSWINVVKLDK